MTAPAQSFNFESVPVIGQAVLLKGQRYELVKIEPYVRSDGVESALLVWRSNCTKCARAFEVRTGVRGTVAVNRRCQIHKAPGRAVLTAGIAQRYGAATTAVR